MGVKSAEKSLDQPSLSETKPRLSEPGLSEVLAALEHLLIMLDGLIVQNAELINQNQQMLEYALNSDPDAEPTRYLDGTPRKARN